MIVINNSSVNTLLKQNKQRIVDATNNSNNNENDLTEINKSVSGID